MRLLALACAAAASIASLAAAASPSVPALVAQAAARDAAQDRIPVSYRWDQRQEIHAGRIFNASERDSYAVAEVGNRVIAARTLLMENNGKPASPADMQKASRDIMNGPSFHVPYEQQYLGEYSYTVDGRTVHFRALVRDGVHGDGRFVTNSNGEVTDVVYTPCVLPPRANAGTIHVMRASWGGGYWGATAIHEEFSGRQLFVVGRMTVDITLSDRAVYPSAVAAKAAVEAAAPAPTERPR